jgi:hypothetical protein
MCLADGWVTEVARRGGQYKMSRAQMLKLLGNGVVPIQAAYAWSRLATMTP